MQIGDLQRGRHGYPEQMQQGTEPQTPTGSSQIINRKRTMLKKNRKLAIKNFIKFDLSPIRNETITKIISIKYV